MLGHDRGGMVGRPVGRPAALRLARSRLLALVALVLLLGFVWLAASTVLLSVLAFLPLIGGGGPNDSGPEGFVGGPGAGPFGSFFGGSFGAFAVSGINLVLTLALAVFALRFLVALPVVVWSGRGPSERRFVPVGRSGSRRRTQPPDRSWSARIVKAPSVAAICSAACFMSTGGLHECLCAPYRDSAPPLRTVRVSRQRARARRRRGSAGVLAACGTVADMATGAAR
jgi:hypothetical protein